MRYDLVHYRSLNVRAITFKSVRKFCTLRAFSRACTRPTTTAGPLRQHLVGFLRIASGDTVRRTPIYGRADRKTMPQIIDDLRRILLPCSGST